MGSRPRRAPLAAILLLVAAAACSDASAPTQGSSVSTASGGPTGPNPTTTTASPGEVPELLDFEAPLLDGATFHGADVAGKDVAFWFWAPW